MSAIELQLNCTRLGILPQNIVILNSVYVCMHTLLQLFFDVKNLVDSLSSNSTNGPCCFQSRNITVVNQPFETNANPIPAIKDIFVSLIQQLLCLQSLCHSNYCYHITRTSTVVEQYITSMMIIMVGVSLSEKHTDLATKYKALR